MPAGDTADATPPPRNRRASEGAVLPGGRRALTLTLDQVAETLQVDVRKVRQLLRLQHDEDVAAAAQNRPSRPIGLRGVYLSKRLTRVTEEALGEFLNGGRSNREQ